MARRVKKNSSAISRARAGALPFCISASAWIDLLGYGSMIAEAGLNPVDDQAKMAISRLRAFHRVVAEHSGRYFRTLVINDGAVVYRDLSLRDDGVTHDFLQRSHRLFRAIAEVEQQNEWPGARMVVGLGFRAKGSRRGINDTERRVSNILNQLAAGEIEAEEAVRKAASIQNYSDGIPQLQANFAFTRAYVADAGGSRVGLGGANMFVDLAMFKDDVAPSWVECGGSIPFNDERLNIECKFIPVTDLRPPGKINDRIPGLRDGLEIGEAIAPTYALRERIRVSR